MPSIAEIVLRDDAFEELRSAAGEAGMLVSFSDNGMIDDDRFSVGSATFRRYKYVPTAEDIARRKEFEASPLGQITRDLWDRCAVEQINQLRERNATLEMLRSNQANNYQWPETVFPRTLRVRLLNGEDL
jgi:hypothetical protein